MLKFLIRCYRRAKLVVGRLAEHVHTPTGYAMRSMLCTRTHVDSRAKSGNSPGT
jgi:hypothetical protein